MQLDAIAAASPTRRLALGVEYDGSAFHGWQRLHALDAIDARTEPTVQFALEQALAFVAGHRVEVTCAGRTDAGVHGGCQVVHFDTMAERSPRGWALGATARLPPAIAVRWCVAVAGDFNARFSARARRYRYRLLNHPVRPALQRQYLAWERRPLDAGAMHAAAQLLVGERDFTSFRTVQCQATHARRDLQRIEVRRDGDIVEVAVQANAFLHHMVRNIVGSLLVVGRGERPPAWIADVLAARDRTVAGPTAPPQGLLFVGPLYPAEWNLPADVTLVDRQHR